ncbi:MAG TPA: hypothetical protein VLG11_06070 [Candidatus Saccharimonadales bacterium]|nr:hypothetical protein [Candidatus Saccharimonadales bacterium]
MNRVGIETMGGGVAVAAPELLVGGEVTEQQVMLHGAARFAAQFGNGVPRTADAITELFESGAPLPVAGGCAWISVQIAPDELRATTWIAGTK